MKTKLVYTFEITGRKELVTGIVLDYGNEWVLLKYVPVDYVVDGYRIIRKKYIKSFYRNIEEEFKESVLKAKGVSFTDDIKYNLNDVSLLFNDILEDRKVVQFDLKDGSICYIGRIEKLSAKKILIKELGTKGNWIEDEFYKMESIRTIQFDNDYITSLLYFQQFVKNQSATT